MFSRDLLEIDASPRKPSGSSNAMRAQVLGVLRRRGAVLGLSGGIDSSVCAALAVRAFGKEKMLGLFMPERETSDDALTLGRMLADELGIDAIVESVGPVLDGARSYERQADAIRLILPEYGDGYKCKLTLPSILSGDRLNVTRLTVQSPSGESKTVRLSPEAYLQIVAATNYKQRVRKMTEYYHADRLNYAVVGTPNRLEYDQGFFVKQGDGVADVKPIAHLYKTQVYRLAEYLGVPEEIRRRPPTTDTFSLPQTQEEFYFALPYDRMDLCLYAHNQNVPAREVAPVVGLEIEQVERVFKDIAAKRRATRQLHLAPLLVEARHRGVSVCGIAGIVAVRGRRGPPERAALVRMASALRHRGPDEFGIYRDARAGFAHARLSIVDLSTGQQPLSNEDRTLWVVFNGEIFNYVELKRELESKGHRFRTKSDTEVIVHAYEAWGDDAFARMNGQWAIALWNARERKLVLTRDRLGVRPLFVCNHGGRLYFGSEVKAIFAADASISREFAPLGLEQTFTFWASLAPRSVFRGVEELRPGRMRTYVDGRVIERAYWNRRTSSKAPARTASGDPSTTRWTPFGSR